MIKIHGPKLDRKLTVACSAGVDSMAIVDFLSKKHDITVAFYHHGKDDNSDECFEFLKEFCKNRSMKFLTSFNKDVSIPKGRSIEEYWRTKRYEFLHSIEGQVITGHHLDDCVENWVWSSMHGESKVIPYANKNVIRPFMTNHKSEFVDWCVRKNVKWVEDKSNVEDLSKVRNYIRNVMMPNVLFVNPGIHKVVAKKVLASV